MKMKVAVWTGAVLCTILLAFNTFIYMTLNHRLISLEENSLANQVEAVAQYQASHLDDERNGSKAWTPATGFWLSEAVRQDQRLVLLTPQGKIIAQAGNSGIPISQIISNFEPSPSLRPTAHTQTWHLGHKVYMSALVAVPNESQSRLLGYGLLVSDAAGVRTYMNTLLIILVMGSIGAVLLATVAGYLVSALAVRPINQMIALVSRIEASNLDERVEVPRGNDEVARLAATFNRMLVRIGRSFEQQARFVADASHEIRTPLTTILGYAGLLKRWGKDDPKVLAKAIDVISKESQRLHELAEDLLTLAGLEATVKQSGHWVHPDRVIQDVIEEMQTLHPELHFVTRLDNQHAIQVPPIHFKQVMHNLINNAVKYTSAGGQVRIKTVDGPNWVEIAVADTGKGIPKSDLPLIFERFYRVDKSRGRKEGGTGLGLAIVKELVELHQGTLEVQSVLGQGTTFTLHFPLSEGRDKEARPMA
ncbi:HAMP domain-containing protein [Alicyclobacillaceae bacterium I2511]|nr:HAMP domain-containing protein [Alicyclobacillaceae bacterium I2511]